MEHSSTYPIAYVTPSGLPASDCLGLEVQIGRTIGESDVYMFAGITGDLNVIHMNEQFMSTSDYGQRIAHGVLTVGLMSTASTKMIERLGVVAVSYGYDKVRFIKPVFIGDTVTVTYRLVEIEADGRRTRAEVTATNQRNETVAVGQHILHFTGALA